MAFEFKIPTGKGGSSSGGTAIKENTKSLKGVSKGVATGNALLQILSSLMGDVMKMFQPLIRILSLLFFIVLLPLLPLIVFLTEKIADFIGIFDMERIAQVGDALLATIQWIFSLPGLILEAIKTHVIEGLKLFGKVLKWVWEHGIKPFGKWLGKIGLWIWEKIIVPGWEVIKNVGATIWEWIKTGFEFFKTIGTKIWDIIKGGFNFVKQGLRNAINAVIDFINSIIPGGMFDIPHLADGGIVTKPTIALVGESGPEAVVPLGKGTGGNTFIINNPHIRDDSDIRKLANEVGIVLQNQGYRRFSSI